LKNVKRGAKLARMWGAYRMRGTPRIVLTVLAVLIVGWLVLKVAGFAFKLILLGALVFGIIFLLRKGMESRRPRL
jgi:uncharacterized membrane protein YccC